MKYILDVGIRKALNAGPKARIDVDEILRKRGYSVFMIVFDKYRILSTLMSFLLIFKIKRKSSVILQYPCAKSFFCKYVLCVLKYFLRCRITLLIHDLDSLRYKGQMEKWEVKNLGMANDIIVHTKEMADLLARYLPNMKRKVLCQFDYLVDKLPSMGETDDSIIFAGSLVKSGFIHSLKEIKACHFKLYGRLPNNESDKIFSGNVIYGGSFEPNDLSALNGKWGLVWDGDSIETCDGLFGMYLKYNAPHKISLYMAAGIPVIVWSQSAMANYVKKKNIGIVVNSLKELPTILNFVKEEQYNIMRQNVNLISVKLREGGMLGDLIMNSK